MKSTEDIVLLGKEEKYDDAALHIYKYRSGWEKMSPRTIPCRHDHEMKILPIMTENNERLLLSCWQCNTIWFYDIDTDKFSVALKEEGFYPWLLCKAEGDYIFVGNWVKGLKSNLKAKCTLTEIIVDKTKTINSMLNDFYSMCYLPNVKCVAISIWKDNVVKAIHCETDEQVWEVMGKVAGVTWNPHGLFYSPEHQSLLVCDADNEWLVVLNPSDGSVLQLILLQHLERPWHLSLYEGNLIVHNGFSNREQINVFNIK